MRDKALRRFGLVRESTLPLREFSVSYHHPVSWNDAPPNPLMSIEGVTRNGLYVTGDLKIADDESQQAYQKTRDVMLAHLSRRAAGPCV